MDVQVVGAAEAVQQQTPSAGIPQGGGTPAPQPVMGSSSNSEHSGELSPALAKLFGGSQKVSVNVSYRVEHDPNIIVTVFTDPTTGAEIAQIPPEVMVQIAQFFDKQSGVTLDRSA